MRKITRRAVAGGLGLLAAGPALAKRKGGRSTEPPSPTINSATLSNTSFIGGSPDNTVVGAVEVNMDTGTFTGTLALSGTHASSFNLSSATLPSDLRTTGVLADGEYAINIVPTQTGAINSGTPYPQTITGTVAGDYSVTYKNTSGSVSPNPTPLTVPMWFAPGDVPSGSIAVPQVGSDLTYQADNRTYWGDGSLMGAVFALLTGSISGGGTVQITFDIRAGTYTNTSSITTADITSGSDHKIEITNCHTAQIGAAGSLGAGSGKVVALTISGGAVNGAKVWYPAGTTVATTNVSNGSGTGAQVSVVAGTPTIVAGGSGYAYVGGTGSFTGSFNTGITTVNTSGNHNGAGLTQYRKGPVCDAWRLRMPISGLPHYHVTFYIERWKNAAGTFIGFKRAAVCGTSLVDTSVAIPNYTYDLDWKDGSTVIRGVSNGDTSFQTMLHFAGASLATFGSLALMDWSADDTVLKAIVQERTPDECDQLKATGVFLPYLDITPTVTVPTTPATYETGSNGGRNFLCNYAPFGCAGIRSPIGASGSGNQLNPINEIDGLYWASLRSGAAGVATWRQNARVGAAHSLGFPQLGSGVYEPTTFYVPNTVPTSAQTFTGMTPTRELSEISLVPLTGFCHPVIGGGNLVTSAGNTYHQVCLTFGPYVFEGEQWMLDTLYNAFAFPLYASQFNYKRQATLGSTTYYGIHCNEVGNVRTTGWLMRSMGYAARMMPPTWSDGTANVEQQYAEYCCKNQHDYLNALVPHIGDVRLGRSGALVSKVTDFSDSGWWPENFHASYNGMELTVPYMDEYVMMVAAHLGWLHQDTALGTSIATWRDYWKNYMVKIWAFAGSHYLSQSYRINNLDVRPGTAVVSDPTWASVGDDADPKIGIYAVATNSTSSLTLSFTSGDPVIVPNFPIRFIATTRIANGSRIKLTPTNIESYFNTGKAAPVNFDFTTWYYWKELTATTGNLCSDAGLTSPVTPGSTVTGLFFWTVPANTPLADDSGSGTYNNQLAVTAFNRVSQTLGVYRLCKAMGMADDANGNVTDAIANLEAIFDSLPGQPGYSIALAYAWDDSRS